MRNPNWTEDELLLVINLYFENSWLDKTNPKVIEMSQILNRLPVHSKENRQKNFRNPNGVEMKLANLRRLDPDYEGEGFIECHHVTPISQLRPDTVVTWKDLILVCSNCHRMIHRKTNLTTIEELRFLIQVELPSN